MPSAVAASASRRPRLPDLPDLESFGLSDRGLVRPVNEDAVVVARDVGLFAVADGVGGNAAGHVASHMAVEIVQHMIEDAAATWPDEPRRAPRREAIQEANAVVHGEASRDPLKAGMATTFTCLLVLNGRRAVIGHVGDSRAYLRHGRSLRQLTEDHTLVNAAVRGGVLTPEQAATAAFRNVIVRAVGEGGTLDVDVRMIAIEPGDLILLATDGLHGVRSEGQIAAALDAEVDLERCATALVALANAAGGPDNVSVVLVRVGL